MNVDVLRYGTKQMGVLWASESVLLLCEQNESYLGIYSVNLTIPQSLQCKYSPSLGWVRIWAPEVKSSKHF